MRDHLLLLAPVIAVASYTLAFTLEGWIPIALIVASSPLYAVWVYAWLNWSVKLNPRVHALIHASSLALLVLSLALTVMGFKNAIGLLLYASTQTTLSALSLPAGFTLRFKRYKSARFTLKTPPALRESVVFIHLDFATGLLFVPSVALGVYLISLNTTVVDVVSLTAGLILLGYGLSGVASTIRGILHPPVETRVKALRKRWYTALIVRRPGLLGLIHGYKEMIKRLLVEAGVFEGPLVYASRFFSPAFLMLILTPALAGLILVEPSLSVILIPLALTPVLIAVYPLLYLYARRGERRRQVEDELPWFTLYASIMQSAGLTVYESLKRLIGKGVLPAMEREAGIAVRNVKLMGRDQVSAVEMIARSHPSRKFSQLVYGYTSILATGGDLTSFLEEKAGEGLRLLEFNLRQYAERSVDLGEVLISLFFVMTTVVLSIGLVSGGSALDLMRAYNYAFIPVASTLIYVLVDGLQSKLRDKFTASHVPPAVLTPVFTVAGLLLAWKPWLTLAFTVLGLSIGYGFQFFLQQRRISMVEKALPEFLRDVTEYRKVGVPVSKAISTLAEKRSYNPVFDELLRDVALQLRIGRRLSDIQVKTGSWLARIVFFILGEVEATGGGTVRVFEELVEYISEYTLIKSEVKRMLRLYEILAYATPVLLALTVSVVSSLTSMVTPGGDLPVEVFPFTFKGLEALMDEAWASVVVSSTALAVLTSKIVDYTVRNTVRAVIIIVITIASILILQPLTPVIAGLITPH